MDLMHVHHAIKAISYKILTMYCLVKKRLETGQAVLLEIKLLVFALYVLETPSEKVIFVLIAHLAADPVHHQASVLIVKMAFTVRMVRQFVHLVLKDAAHVQIKVTTLVLLYALLALTLRKPL